MYSINTTKGDFVFTNIYKMFICFDTSVRSTSKDGTIFFLAILDTLTSSVVLKLVIKITAGRREQKNMESPFNTMLQSALDQIYAGAVLFCDCWEHQKGFIY